MKWIFLMQVDKWGQNLASHLAASLTYRTPSCQSEITWANVPQFDFASALAESNKAKRKKQHDCLRPKDYVCPTEFINYPSCCLCLLTSVPMTQEDTNDPVFVSFLRVHIMYSLVACLLHFVLKNLKVLGFCSSKANIIVSSNREKKWQYTCMHKSTNMQVSCKHPSDYQYWLLFFVASSSLWFEYVVLCFT